MISKKDLKVYEFKQIENYFDFNLLFLIILNNY